MKPNTIRYVSRADIDEAEWDECITTAPNGLIYAYAFYLDRMSKHWDALILGDYQAVMPLTWNRKAGFSYLYQPAFTPSLGVFGKGLNAEMVREFMLSIPKTYQLIEISLNTANESKEIYETPINGYTRANYVLSLTLSYQQLYNEYNDNIKRNIKRAVSLGCVVEKNIPVQQVVALAQRQLNNITNLKKEDFENFISLYTELAARKQAVTYGISLNSELLSSAVYFFSHGRAYYILVGNHPNGKTMGTSHFLIDRFIADHASQQLILDFEGSDIPSLAFFYQSFGARLEHFPAIKWNRLPWYVRWLK